MKTYTKKSSVLGFFIFTLLMGCAHKPTAGTGLHDPPPEFQMGLTALDQERYADAAQAFDHLLVAHPATEYDLVVLYDSASAYEGLGQCRTAAIRYRRLIRSAGTKFDRIKSQGFFRLGLMYECMGNDVKTITSLLDAKHYGATLPLEIREGEIPARLAAAYARLGNHARAIDYFNEATSGLKAVVDSAGSHVDKKLLGRTLYMMGKLNSSQRLAEVPPVKYLQSLSMQQPYLLQAMDLQEKIWSGKAATDLATAYDNLWKFQFKDSKQRRDFYIRALQTISQLKAIRLPSQDPVETGFFQDLDKHESRLKYALAKDGVTTKLTPEAQKRQGLKREGRLTK